ncbi:MAG: NUDIX hydrolase [Candidatus Andersenbacteria bacterium]|nr:NUDIX hydrolase [bacterium]MDZ4225229.1 NUDIX hydrolase [Candidatus Andersenbacteria bacterium]
MAIIKHTWCGKFVSVRVEERGSQTLEIVHVRNGVTVVPIFPDGRLCLIRERSWKTQQMVTKPVTGFIDDNENPWAAARRELAEEIGFEAGEWELALTSTKNDVIEHQQFCFVCHDLTATSPHPEPGEYIEKLVKLTPAEVQQRTLGLEFGSNITAFFLLRLATQLLENSGK